MDSFKFNLTIVSLITGISLSILSCEKEGNNDPGINDCEKSYLTGDTFTDMRDSNKYKWVNIGNQIWMAENLAYLPYVFPSSEGSDTESFYYVYDYQGTNTFEAKSTCNYKRYGVLYNWNAVMKGSDTSNLNPSGVQGVCPTGWHMPSDVEWKELEMFLGMSQSEVDKKTSRGSTEGGKLKEIGTSLWESPNTGATNSSSFSSLPSGDCKEYGVFSYKGKAAFYWTTTGHGYEAFYRYLKYNEAGIGRFYWNKKIGFSVRCVKD